MKDVYGTGPKGRGRFNNTLYGVLIGALLVCLVWLIATAWGGGSSGSATPRTPSDPTPAMVQASAGGQSTASATGSGDHRVDQVAAHLERCRAVYLAQDKPLSAAEAAMAQWQIHIAAMNKLVLGVITIDQANQFWNQTRVGARQHLQAFTAALRRYDQRSAHCTPVPKRLSSHHVQRCQQAVKARNIVLGDARRALATWAMHVKHMDMLRDGMMSPDRAEQLWLQSWHEGQQQVDRYHADDQATSAATGC